LTSASRLWADAIVSHRGSGDGENDETDLDQV
jgi:hypothetical protein